jgi:hypothetical protein
MVPSARTHGPEVLSRQVLEAVQKFSNGKNRDDASLIAVSVG